ncbi:50S ribosomal protein L24 [Chrysiogenes arsenatis]|uniref:50S ribosomal protein L24 n=1 Tax=Chrysiogenes arsenatis TaxID=309797 RepID=UPI00040946AD|nr:50S ribosomal protein L24 [Chrysiogenes arsenatis]
MSQAKVKIKKDDQIIVIAGKDKGKTGRVAKVYPSDKKVVVEGINVVKRHVKASPQTGNDGGIIEKEMALDISNVMYYDADTKKGCRVGFKMQDGSKVRFCKQTGKVID